MVKQRSIFIILFIFFLVSVASIYFSYLATITNENFVAKQIIWYVIGFGFLYIIHLVGNNFFYNHAFALYIVCNIMLLILLIFGNPINNAKCWFNIGGFLTIQPSEFMKIALIIFLAKFFSNQKENMSVKEEFIFLLKVIGIVALPSLLTFLEPDTGVVIIYFIITITMLFIFGIRYRWFIILGSILLFVIGSILFLYFFNSKLFINIFGNSFFLRIDRLLDWSNSDGYQLKHSLYAIGAAGITGNKLNINIPEAQTDFIFSVLAGSFGFIASVFVILLFLYFDYKIICIAKKCSKKIDKYTIAGFSGMLIYQQFQNIAMTMGIMPITGITLPFISYGGSSLISYMLIIGIILNTIKKEPRL